MKKITQQEAEDELSIYAEADARLQKLVAKLELEIIKIREKYNQEIIELNETIEDKTKILNQFADDNSELFQPKKSLELLHGTIGFRIGKPKLKLLRGFTWASVTQLLKEFLPEYVRKAEEPMKDKLLADRENESVNKKFPKLGIKIIQEETFYIEPKKEM